MSDALAPSARARPRGVTIVGAVQIVLGVLAGILAILVAIFALGGDLPATVEARLERSYGGILLGGAIFGAAAILGIAAGQGALDGARWGWTLTIVNLALAAASGARGLLVARDAAAIAWTVTLNAPYLAAIAYFFTPAVKRYFSRS